jgi:hypothetical protein
MATGDVADSPLSLSLPLEASPSLTERRLRLGMVRSMSSNISYPSLTKFMACRTASLAELERSPSSKVPRGSFAADG